MVGWLVGWLVDWMGAFEYEKTPKKKENSINIFIITTDQKKEFSSSPRLFIEASKNTCSNINEIYVDLSSDELQNLTIQK